MATQNAPYPKDQKLLDAYSMLAEATLDVQTAHFLDRSKTYPELVRPTRELSAGNKYTYPVLLKYVALFFGATIAAYFYDSDRSNLLAVFTSGIGGLGLGEGQTWGTAWMNYDVKTLIGSEANCNLNFWVVTTNVNWLTVGNNEPIGSCVAGGLGFGGGIGGGKGIFSSAS